MSKVKRANLKVSGMHCVSCSLLIDIDLSELRGIKSVKTSFAKSVCEVEFDEEVISLSAIIEALKKSGYQALPKNV